jgi:hypothetical protein
MLARQFVAPRDEDKARDERANAGKSVDSDSCCVQVHLVAESPIQATKEDRCLALLQRRKSED